MTGRFNVEPASQLQPTTSVNSMTLQSLEAQFEQLKAEAQQLAADIQRRTNENTNDSASIQQIQGKLMLLQQLHSELKMEEALKQGPTDTPEARQAAFEVLPDPTEPEPTSDAPQASTEASFDANGGEPQE